MFKSARWRSEKNKVKSVFKLQFHATQLKQITGDTLIISIIPADVGKPTTKLEKAKIKDGSCYWEKPHYETVKFIQDPKNGKFNEKIYHFVLATGSSKSSSVGEASIDFANFTEAAKSFSFSLPLKSTKCAAFLHVSIQRVQDSLDQREIDVIEHTDRHDRTLRAKLSNNDTEEFIKINPTEDRETLTDNRDRQGSSGSDITLSASDISSGLETIQEPEPMNTKPVHEPSVTTTYEERHMSQWDWLDGSPTDLSTDDSSPSIMEPVSEEIHEDDSPESVIKKLENEIAVLARQADVTELELQTLRKQIVKERKKGLELSREVIAVIEERNSFKEECEKLKENRKCLDETQVKVKGDPWDLVDELRQELNYEKDLNCNLRLQLQKTQESNAELILAVQDLDAMLEQKDSDMSKSKSESKSKCSEMDDDEDQKALEDIVRQHSGMQETRLLEQKINDLYGEIESYKRDKDELEMQIDQMALDYEILKQGNHDMCYKLEQSQLQEQLNIQYESQPYDVVNELETQIESLKIKLSEYESQPYDVVNELKTQIESLKNKLSESVLENEKLENIIKNLEKGFEDQTRGFEADIEDLVNAKVEQEQRAIRAEERLRKLKLQNVNTAERLQEEFKKLSAQMNSSFEENEKVAIKAIDEANQLRVEKRNLEEIVKKVENDCEEKMVDFLSQISQKSKELEQMEKQIERLEHDNKILEDERKNLENVNKQKDETYERLKLEIECFESRYNEMKLSLMEDESEKEKLKKEVFRLKDEIKKKEDGLISMKKKIKDGSKSVLRNNNPNLKEMNNLKNKVELLENQIKTKETALKSSEDSFLEKEKDLQFKINELEKRLKILDENTAVSQASAADEIASLKRLNESMEVELVEMQERYSEISLKFAEVEGERQKLVMTLRNLKNSKKC